MSNSAPIQLGMNARLFPTNWRPARDEIVFAARSGFQSIQFNGREYGLDTSYLGADPTIIGQALHIAKLLPVMEIVVRLDTEGRTSTGMTAMDVLRNNLSAIQALGCRFVHWHLVPAKRMSGTELRALERAGRAWLFEAVEFAAQAGFQFGFEPNEPDIPLFASPKLCADLIDDIPGLGLVWDVNHTIPEHLGAFLELAPLMQMLHLSDTPLPEVNHHLPIGLGSVNFAKIFHQLNQGGFTGPAILEIGGLPKSGGYSRDTDEALTDSLRQLTEMLTLLGIPTR